MYKCNWCTEICQSAAETAKHDLVFHTNIERYICYQCGLKTVSPGALIMHLTEVHPVIEKICSICKIRFVDSSSFCSHMYQEILSFLEQFYLRNPGVPLL